MDINELFAGLASGLAFGLVGTVLLALGYLLVDLLTPGRLGQLIWTERNRNAALVLASNALGVGAIVTTAIATSHDEFVQGLISAAGYGVLGLILMAISFAVVDFLTPGRLGELCVDADPHPCAWVVAANHVAVAAIVSAAIA
ncbi:DUF350 domain-containing protein [Carbonactinospora thermoautotrophica]|uniref:DUF350 domain-containing protein n=1 Tax=Carbonactinospora thermoautotrophica TaxID=1469144 RepID=UPI0023EE475B|nr:DUF350 domain-containing protein [Carbonactinospora thermoautotrophica]